MEIKTLAGVSLSTLTAVFNQAFTGYFVPINMSEEGMADRLARARIDLSQSIGTFTKDGLVAFMLTGIEQRGDRKVAYNAGTGVIPDYRRQRLVKQMYAWAEDFWRAAGFTDLTLEVIVENKYAIKAYEGVGFRIERRLASFKYQRDDAASSSSELEQVEKPNWPSYAQLRAFAPSWDFNQAGVEAVKQDYEFFEGSSATGDAFAIVHKNGRIAQAGCSSGTVEDWDRLLSNLEKQHNSLTWVNIDVKAEALLEAVQQRGWEPIIEQYEMFRSL